MGTSINERALSLLGAGVPQENVASAVGVTPGYISQLLSDENFAKQVVQLKFEALSKHTERDASYDALEDSLIAKLGKSLPLIIRPADILGAIRIINGAKRRGHDSPDSLVSQSNIVSITMPTQIIQQFTTNIANQVIKTGEQDLRTMASGDLLKKVPAELPAPELAPASAPAATKKSTTDYNSVLEGDSLLASL